MRNTTRGKKRRAKRFTIQIQKTEEGAGYIRVRADDIRPYKERVVYQQIGITKFHEKPLIK